MGRKDGKSIWASPETHALLTTYAQSKKIGVKTILDLVVPQIIEHDLYDPNWVDKLKAAQKTTDLLARLGDECPGLAVGTSRTDKEGDFTFRCFWYRFDGPPKMRILGKTESLQKSACAACDRTRKIVQGLLDRDEKIIELEASLKARADEVFKAPVCNVGAILSAHGTQFSGCRRHPGEPVSIDGFCRVYRSGLPCMSFAEVVIGVGAK